MARLKGTTHNTAIPQIDVGALATCLACPLPECVYMFDGVPQGEAKRSGLRGQIVTIRQRCPIWQAERDRCAENMRRWRAKKNQPREIKK